MNAGQILTTVVGAVALGSAIVMVVSRNMITSILSMIAAFLSLAVLYLTLDAQFVAIMQVLVYAGGIIVLFLFVIMLLNLGSNGQHQKPNYKTMIIIALGVVFLVEVTTVISSATGTKVTSLPAHAAQLGTVEYIGKALYTNYSFPFELVSLLLIAGVVGAMFLARKKLGQ